MNRRNCIFAISCLFLMGILLFCILLFCMTTREYFRNFKIVHARMARVHTEDTLCARRTVFLLDIIAEPSNSRRELALFARNSFTDGTLDSVRDLRFEDKNGQNVNAHISCLDCYNGYDFDRIYVSSGGANKDRISIRNHKSLLEYYHVPAGLFAEEIKGLLNAKGPNMRSLVKYDSQDKPLHFYCLFNVKDGAPVPERVIVDFPNREVAGDMDEDFSGYAVVQIDTLGKEGHRGTAWARKEVEE